MSDEAKSLPIPGVEGLFGDETVAQANAKALAYETFIRALAREQKFAEFAREILVAMMRAVPCEAGSLLEVNSAVNSLFFRAVVGQSAEKVADFVVPMGQGIVGHVAESRQSLVVDNAQEHELHLKSIGDTVGFVPRNIVAIPILIRGKVYGVLELLNRLGDSGFTSADLQLLNTLCDVAARVIEVRLMIAWAMQQSPNKPVAA